MKNTAICILLVLLAIATLIIFGYEKGYQDDSPEFIVLAEESPTARDVLAGHELPGKDYQIDTLLSKKMGDEDGTFVMVVLNKASDPLLTIAFAEDNEVITLDKLAEIGHVEVESTSRPFVLLIKYFDKDGKVITTTDLNLDFTKPPKKKPQNVTI